MAFLFVFLYLKQEVLFEDRTVSECGGILAIKNLTESHTKRKNIALYAPEDKLVESQALQA